MRNPAGEQLFDRYYIITPKQFARMWGRNLSHMSGYQRFWLAEIQDAFNDVLLPSEDPRRQADRHLALEWFRGHIEGRISFAMCCEGLNFDVSWLRRGILKLLHDPELMRLSRSSVLRINVPG